MALRVTTTGTNVILTDLGISINHPTSNRDLSLEFTAIELKNSIQLTTAIQNGYLLVDDGSFSIDATDYDPDEVLLQDLGLRGDTKYISNNELYSDGTIEIKSAIFPLSINSTASITKNVYIPSAKWKTWELEVGDLLTISGSAAVGNYTVESVTDQQNLITVESIVNSTGGYLTAYHPAGTTKIRAKDNFENISGDNLQELLESIDQSLIATSGITVGSHRSLDQLVHLVAEDSFEEYTYSGLNVINCIVWSDNNKTLKIREENFSYSPNKKVEIITTTQYDSLGNVEEVMTETYTYSGIRVISVDRELV
jgi:hypothetical protein